MLAPLACLLFSSGFQIKINPLSSYDAKRLSSIAGGARIPGGRGEHISRFWKFYKSPDLASTLL